MYKKWQAKNFNVNLMIDRCEVNLDAPLSGQIRSLFGSYAPFLLHFVQANDAKPTAIFSSGSVCLPPALSTLFNRLMRLI
jgi:hypothetical protein